MISIVLTVSSDGPRADDPLGIAYRQAAKGKRTPLKPGDEIPVAGALSSVVLASGGKVVTPPAGSALNPHCAEPVSAQPVDHSDNCAAWRSGSGSASSISLIAAT